MKGVYKIKSSEDVWYVPQDEIGFSEDYVKVKTKTRTYLVPIDDYADISLGKIKMPSEAYKIIKKKVCLNEALYLKGISFCKVKRVKEKNVLKLIGQRIKEISDSNSIGSYLRRYGLEGRLDAQAHLSELLEAGCSIIDEETLLKNRFLSY